MQQRRFRGYRSGARPDAASQWRVIILTQRWLKLCNSFRSQTALVGSEARVKLHPARTFREVFEKLVALHRGRVSTLPGTRSWPSSVAPSKLCAARPRSRRQCAPATTNCKRTGRSGSAWGQSWRSTINSVTENSAGSFQFVVPPPGVDIYNGTFGRPRPHRRCWTARSDLGKRWPSRLVATAEEGRLS